MIPVKSEKYAQLVQDLKETEVYAENETDSEMKKELTDEIESILNQLEQLEKEYYPVLTTPDEIRHGLDNEYESVHIEIDAGQNGAGGETVIELYELYKLYCDHMDWTIGSEDFEKLDGTFDNEGYRRLGLRFCSYSHPSN